jgi:hypothetical protein
VNIFAAVPTFMGSVGLTGVEALVSAICAVALWVVSVSASGACEQAHSVKAAKKAGIKTVLDMVYFL